MFCGNLWYNYSWCYHFTFWNTLSDHDHGHAVLATQWFTAGPGNITADVYNHVITLRGVVLGWTVGVLCVCAFVYNLHGRRGVARHFGAVN